MYYNQFNYFINNCSFYTVACSCAIQCILATQVKLHGMIYIVHREILAPVLYSPLVSSLPVGEFKTGQVPMSQILSLLTLLCLGEFKTGQSHLQMYIGQK